MSGLPGAAAALARLFPAADRESILGDLLEESVFRDLSGGRRTWWLCSECAAIAAGLTLQRLRARATMPPLREVAAGLAVEGSLAVRLREGGIATRGAIFCAALILLVYGVEQLVATLLAAGGLGR